jgi:bacterioferritin (cytochrome b1)
MRQGSQGVIAVLNDDVVATGIVCRMRYTRHAISAAGINRAQVAGELTGHAESYETCRDEDLKGMLRDDLVDLLGA